MTRKLVLILVAVNSVGLVLSAVLWPQLMIAPGQVMPAHRAFASDCFACHRPFIGSRPALCSECHKPDAIGLVTTKGLAIANEQKLRPFHQDLLEPDCMACHSDHKGVKAFRPIGRFSHELLRTARREQCRDCHAAPPDTLHQGDLHACRQCHSEQAWTPATFDHEPLFSLTGHHEVACKTCHVGRDYQTYTCYGCHEHTRSKIREKHVEEGITDYENCVKCHRSDESIEDEHQDQGRAGRMEHGDDESSSRDTEEKPEHHSRKEDD